MTVWLSEGKKGWNSLAKSQLYCRSRSLFWKYCVTQLTHSLKENNNIKKNVRKWMLRNEVVGTSIHSIDLPFLLRNPIYNLTWFVSFLNGAYAEFLNSNGAHIYLRQAPLGLSFWSFLTFLHHDIEEVERHLLWKFQKKNSKEDLVKCATEVARFHKVSIQSCTQIGRLRKFNRAREIEFNFFYLLDYLYETWHTCLSCSWRQNFASDFLIFAWGLCYGLSKSKNRGKIITKLWKIITKSLGKN